MLKIKDDVDLKELEKYGFYIRPTIIGFNYELDIETDRGIHSLITIHYLTASKKDKYDLIKSTRIHGEIEINEDFSNECLSILFGLILAGLVEKAEEKENGNN